MPEYGAIIAGTGSFVSDDRSAEKSSIPQPVGASILVFVTSIFLSAAKSSS